MTRINVIAKVTYFKKNQATHSEIKNLLVSKLNSRSCWKLYRGNLNFCSPMFSFRWDFRKPLKDNQYFNKFGRINCQFLLKSIFFSLISAPLGIFYISLLFKWQKQNNVCLNNTKNNLFKLFKCQTGSRAEKFRIFDEKFQQLFPCK